MFVVWIVVLASVSIKISSCAPVTDGQLTDSVLLTFSNVSLDQWHHENKSSTLKLTSANLSTTYCYVNPLECGLSSGIPSVTIQSSHVKFMENYPVNNDNNDLEILLFVELPTSSSNNPVRIPENALMDIFVNGKSQLSLNVGVRIVSVVSGVALFSTKKEIDRKLNKIMIPVSFMLLVIVALIAWVLHRSHKRRIAQVEREMHKRYMNLQNTKKTERNFAVGGVSERCLLSNNFAHGMPVQFRQVGGGSGPALPEPDSPENECRVQVEKRHRRRKKGKKLTNVKRPTDESDDVFDEYIEDQKSEADVPERSKKKGRRHRTHRSSNQEHPGTSVEENYVIQKGDLNGEYEQEKEEKEGCQVNIGYQEDSENALSGRSRTSDGDSAVKLTSSFASAQHNRPKILPPVAQTKQELLAYEMTNAIVKEIKLEPSSFLGLIKLVLLFILFPLIFALAVFNYLGRVF